MARPEQFVGRRLNFLATLKDDRKLLASVDGNTFEEISRKLAA